MTNAASDPAAFTQPEPSVIALAGPWTALSLGTLEAQLLAVTAPSEGRLVIEAAAVTALDTAGAWSLQTLIRRLRAQGTQVTLHAMPAQFSALLEAVEQHLDERITTPITEPPPNALANLGRAVMEQWTQTLALLGFLGECTLVGIGCLRRPTRIRWRPILFNLRTAGFDALPIVGLLAFLLGVVVAYQGADQLRQYGANIFVTDLIGLSMLREFAPLITAIIIAGRSGSAYAAQIGTMAVTEEIDAMRTIGIAPLEMLVWPKIVALVVALPLLTVLADGLGVFGGMIMARAQLGVGFAEFLERFVKAISPTDYLIGIGKAPVFAMIIVVIGCFQGFQTHGGADSAGRHTTHSVVQSIFLVIVADALFSVAFSALDL